MDYDLIINNYCNNKYFDIIQYYETFYNNELTNKLKPNFFSRLNLMEMEIYLFSLIRNKQNHKFDNNNFKRVFYYYSKDTNNVRHQYNSETILNFGKYEGSTIEDVINIEPSYIYWCIENIGYFRITSKVLFEIALQNKTFSLDTLELNILKNDILNKTWKNKLSNINSRIIKPWEINVEELKKNSLSAFETIEYYSENCTDSQIENNYDILSFSSRILLLYYNIFTIDYS